MRKRNLAAAILLLTVGCNADVNTPSNGTDDSAFNETGDRGATDGSGDTSATGVWAFERANSSLDGEMLFAYRTFEFPNSDALFVVNLSCAEESRAVSLVVQSVVGDQNAPSEGSRLLSDATGQPITQYTAQLSMYPKGRIRVGDRQVEDLSAYFRIDQVHGNYANFGLINPLTFDLINREAGTNIGEMVVRDDEVSKAKVILASMPMVIEIANGAGLFELQIEPSSEVLATLRACGSDDALLSESFLQRIRQSE